MKNILQIKFLVISGIAIAFLASCSQIEQELNDSEIAAVEKEVLSAFAIFESSLVAGDLDAIAKYYSDDFRFYWVENGQVAYPTGASARAAISNFYPSLKRMEFKSLDKKVTPLQKTMAMLFVEYEQTLVFPSDEEVNINGAMTILMKKLNDRWEFVIGHSSGKN